VARRVSSALLSQALFSSAASRIVHRAFVFFFFSYVTLSWNFFWPRFLRSRRIRWFQGQGRYPFHHVYPESCRAIIGNTARGPQSAQQSPCLPILLPTYRLRCKDTVSYMPRLPMSWGAMEASTRCHSKRRPRRKPVMPSMSLRVRDACAHPAPWRIRRTRRCVRRRGNDDRLTRFHSSRPPTR
jgi:hypothetical protein